MIKKCKNLFTNLSIMLIVILLFLAVFEAILSQTSIKVNEYNTKLFKEDILEANTSLINSTFEEFDPNRPIDTPFKPNAYVVFRGMGGNKMDPTVIKINSQGLRDYEYSVEKPANTFRILGLGDSFTFGHGVELDETYLKVLEKKLNSMGSGVRYEVMNFGVGGYNTQQAVELLKVKGLAYKPDMVILLCSVNDIKNSPDSMDRLNLINNPKMVYKVLGNSYIGSWVYTKLYNIKTKRAVELEEKNFFLNYWEGLQVSLEGLYNLAKENSFTVVLLRPEDSFISDKYMEFSTKHDFYETLYILNESLKLQRDNHPNPSGHELMAEELYTILIDEKLIPDKK